MHSLFFCAVCKKRMSLLVWAHPFWLMGLADMESGCYIPGCNGILSMRFW